MEKSSDLEAFILSLRTEGEEELRKLKVQVEDQIADMIALRRNEVELEIGNILEQHSRILAKEEAFLVSKHRGKILEAIEGLQLELCDRVRSMIESKLDSLLASDSYKDSLERLLSEVVQKAGASSTVVVPPSQVESLSSKGYKVQGGTLDRWGGCIAIDEEGGAIFENTYRGRLERLFPEIVRELAIMFDEVLEKHEFISERLRIS
ncbi:V-type ATP synthase subunit E [Dethiosulfovibrio salsuginis]|uniref:H+-ATPase subunit E/Vma4 n=1 Tax=Dethiosulfovibrio salsuginis TaxID=561720 RepID=A0A1X7I5C0_9BACT|nr:V-type ATP synthase subunit E [Dethiosulfovibrio salsuginis]SMG09638.1 H+-ATPase subunit E/Vma4 [Dethiosulfovibrio salsuginis]